MSQALAHSAAPHAVAHDAMLNDLEALPRTRALVTGIRPAPPPCA